MKGFTLRLVQYRTYLTRIVVTEGFLRRKCSAGYGSPRLVIYIRFFYRANF